MSPEDTRMHQSKMAFVVGHTSRTGKALVNELLKRNVFRKLILVGRRDVPVEGELYNNVVSLNVSLSAPAGVCSHRKNLRPGPSTRRPGPIGLLNYRARTDSARLSLKITINENLTENLQNYGYCYRSLHLLISD